MNSRELKLERYLREKLGMLGPLLQFSEDDRRESVRTVITERGVADQLCGHTASGEARSFREVFEQVFGTPLATNETQIAVTAGGR